MRYFMGDTYLCLNRVVINEALEMMVHEAPEPDFSCHLVI